jgi:hypothetical protein
MRCSGIGGVGICPPKAKITRSNRVGCAIFLFYSAICAPGLKLQLCLIRASKQSGGKSSPNTDSFVRRPHSTIILVDKSPTRYPTCSLVTADPAIGEIERTILPDMNGLMVRSKTYKYGEKFQISTRWAVPCRNTSVPRWHDRRNAPHANSSRTSRS